MIHVSPVLSGTLFNLISLCDSVTLVIACSESVSFFLKVIFLFSMWSDTKDHNTFSFAGCYQTLASGLGRRY